MITLTNSTAQAVINPEAGAWVETLTLGEQPILFPKTDLMNGAGERKTRGGMHVCLPNFGPGGSSSLAQHGFGRLLPWEMTHRTSDSVALKLQNAHSQYSYLVSQVTYTLENNTLTSTLRLQNSGKSSVRVAPGFHPYFYLDESETAISINDTLYELSNLAGTVFLTTDMVQLQTASQRLSLSQENLSTWAIWTDGLANYVCVEPTYGGYRFLQPSEREEQILPGSEKSYRFSFTWQ